MMHYHLVKRNNLDLDNSSFQIVFFLILIDRKLNYNLLAEFRMCANRFHSSYSTEHGTKHLKSIFNHIFSLNSLRLSPDYFCCSDSFLSPSAI